MLHALDIANYFLKKDVSKKYFNKNLINKNDRQFYEGNVRLNKYLHLSQNIFIAKTGNKLFEDDLYASDDGAIVPDISNRYLCLVSKPDSNIIFSEDINVFLDKIYIVLKNASVDELINLSCEDPEWKDKQRFLKKTEQRMNSISYADEYKNQYKDIIKVMGRLDV